MAEAARSGAPVEQVLAAEGLAPREVILDAQARQHGLMVLDRHKTPPDPSLGGLLPPEYCLAHGVLPWRRIGTTLVLACAHADRLDAILAQLPVRLGPVIPALVLESALQEEIAQRHGAALAAHAERQVPVDMSCRDLNRLSFKALLAGIAIASLSLATLVLMPAVFFGLALAVAVLSLVLSQGLRLAALLACSLRRRPPQTTPAGRAFPHVSMLVPLYRERDIARALTQRLSRLTYPKARLEVILILEQGDAQTRAALQGCAMPPWMRVIEVPPGAVTTKPRALNYALGFTKGDIVGIYDAEDAPASDQIERMVDRFAKAPERVACLQGILDFYNPRANWLSRCFTIEYATWFRILLPGLARLGFAVPLGGTTVFIKRSALEDVGGWDAHNVTEDADLGIRLARAGYQTQLLSSTTREEANNRLWPWIRQRSRWLKGYAVTWWVHARRPLALRQDLGLWKTLGFHGLFLTTLLQFALAPVLWSFWLVIFGLPHPASDWLSDRAMTALVVTFLTAEGVSILVSLAAMARSPHARLMPWVPTLLAYYPLGTVALFKGLWEIVARPFYWDKTTHGRSAPDTPQADVPPDTL